MNLKAVTFFSLYTALGFSSTVNAQDTTCSAGAVCSVPSIPGYFVEDAFDFQMSDTVYGYWTMDTVAFGVVTTSTKGSKIGEQEGLTKWWAGNSEGGTVSGCWPNELSLSNEPTSFTCVTSSGE
jgi:hypothetical protein